MCRGIEGSTGGLLVEGNPLVDNTEGISCLTSTAGTTGIGMYTIAEYCGAGGEDVLFSTCVRGSVVNGVAVAVVARLLGILIFRDCGPSDAGRFWGKETAMDDPGVGVDVSG